MLIKHLKQGTQAKEPTGLIRAIRIIRVLKKAVCVLKEHEICRRPTDQREVIKRIYRILIKIIKQGTQAAEPTGLIRFGSDD